MSGRGKGPHVKSKRTIILSTSGDIQGLEVLRYLGIAFGHRRVEGDTNGKNCVREGSTTWPWAETPEHYEALFRLTEGDLRHNAEIMGADAVIGCSLLIDRDYEGRPGLTLTGTAVLTARGEPDLTDLQNKHSLPEGVESEPPGGDVRIAFAGMSKEWKPLSAVQRPTPRRKEAHDMEKKAPDSERTARELANILGVSQDTALDLVGAGIHTVGEVATSNPADLARICKLNPTQARLLVQRASGILAREDA